MEERPKKLIARVAEYAALFALAVFLIKMGVCWLTEMWWILLIIAAIATAAVIGFRVWRNKKRW